MIQDHLNNPAFVRAFANAIMNSKLKQSKPKGDITNSTVIPEIIEVPPITKEVIPQKPIPKPRSLKVIAISEPAPVTTKSTPTNSKLSANDWLIVGGILAGGIALYYWGFYLPEKKKNEKK